MMLRSGLLLVLLGFASLSQAALIRFDVAFDVNASPGSPTNWTGAGAVPLTITGSWTMDSEVFASAEYTFGQLTPASAETLARYAVGGIGVTGASFFADGMELWSADSASGELSGDQTSTFSYDSVLGVADGSRSLTFVHARSGPPPTTDEFQSFLDPVSALLFSFTSMNVALLTGEWGRLALDPVMVSATSVPEPGTLALMALAITGMVLARRRQRR